MGERIKIGRKEPGVGLTRDNWEKPHQQLMQVLGRRNMRIFKERWGLNSNDNNSNLDFRMGSKNGKIKKGLESFLWDEESFSKHSSRRGECKRNRALRHLH